jgi:FAD:protein FMN transferase
MSGIKRPWGLISKSIINVFLLSLLFSCDSGSTQNEIEGFVFQGETQGTTYTVIIAEEEVHFKQNEIDSILAAFDASLSTYIPNSVISMINTAESEIMLSDPTGFFKECYQQSQKVYQRTAGVFDPSVYPLVEGWGFLKDLKTPLSQDKVDSILSFVSFEKNNLHSVDFNGDSIRFKKKDSRFKIDFNAIAQGYSVDVISDFIHSRGHRNYYVEIGGELVVKGLNREQKPWKIGIDAPTEQQKSDVRQLENVMSLSGKALATSGNYRKFYELNGKKYSHTLDPKTGYPVNHSLLSATVICNKASKADAYATAFMVMGLEKTKEFLSENKDLKLEVYLIFDEKGKFGRWYSEGVEKYLDR